jgi:hypothetical protein
MELENINPNIFKKSDERPVTESELNENTTDPIDSREVFGNFLAFSSFM